MTTSEEFKKLWHEPSPSVVLIEILAKLEHIEACLNSNEKVK